MEILKGIVGTELVLPIVEDTVETGHDIDDYTILAISGSIVYDPADLDPSVTEVNSSTTPGYYELRLTPLAADTLYLKVTRGLATFEFAVQVELNTKVADHAQEGDYLLTIESGVSPVPIQGATVRVFDVAGTTLVTRGTTDSLGRVTFPLPAGMYQVRVNKTGYDFSDISPSNITVMPNSDVSPQLSELVPATGEIGDVIAISGLYFELDSSEVLFGAEETVDPIAVSSDGKTVVVEVPAGLTLTAIPLRVRKPDPNNPGEYLLSNVLTFTRTT